MFSELTEMEVSTLNNHTNTSVQNNESESLFDLNARYAEALLPLTATFGVFVLLGFLGNLIIILVFTLSRDYRHNNFKIFVLTLAVIDIITCVTLIPAEMIKHRHYFAFGDVASCKAKCFFNVFGAAASCLALLVISIDRYRKVVQPFKKQMTPKLAIQVLFVVAFIFPVLLAIPGTIMCGIKTTSMTNIHGDETTINLCETEDKFRFSIWRMIYKYTFIILLVGISFTYIVLYTFVMKEAIKQIRSIAGIRRNSSRAMGFVSSFYSRNMSFKASMFSRSSKTQGNDTPKIDAPKEQGSSVFVTTGPTTAENEVPTTNQASVRQRQRFPTKTLVWFILTFVFIISYMTHLILALQVADIVKMSPSEFVGFSFCFRIYFVNHMINPLIYAIFVKRFRKSCSVLIPTLKNKLRNCST
ncbi:hypothetical protein ACF0H5_009143 [Mactra antiquata]